MHSGRWNKDNIINENDTVPEDKPELRSMDDRLLDRLKEFILKNLENENFGVEDLADEVAFSRSHLYRKIQALTGKSISAFIRTVRLEKAHEMIMADVATISEIAFKVGFGSSTYFTKCFHDAYGYPPGETRQRMAGNGDAAATDISTKPNEAVRRGVMIESLHPTADSPLIEEIFRALADHKPGLQKFLMVDEDEGETLDMRLLAYQVIKSFPWPLGVQLRRLFSASMLEPDHNRIQQIHKTIRFSLRFMVFLACSELCQLLKNGDHCLEKSEAKELVEGLERLSDKDLLSILSLLRICLSKKGIKISELKDFYSESLAREMESWLELQQNENTGDDPGTMCSSLEQSLMVLLKRMSFLAAYKLVNVSSIRVRKPKFGEVSFEHHFHLLNSADSDFHKHEERLQSYSDSDAVLLMSSIRLTDDVLNLEPFVVDTYEEKPLDGSGGMRTKRDLYLYAGYNNGKLNYEGSEVTNSVDLSSFHQYPGWIDSFEQTRNLITGS